VTDRICGTGGALEPMRRERAARGARLEPPTVLNAFARDPELGVKRSTGHTHTHTH